MTDDDDIIHVPAQSPSKVPCKIAFLAEAPGDEELLEGKPLVGPSGRIFNSLLRAANLDRKDFWVGNVFDQKIPDNDLSNWTVTKAEAERLGWEPFPTAPGGGQLRPEFRTHLHRLGAELHAAKPNVIVPLGGTALWALTERSSIGDFRGSLDKASWIAAGTKILPTFHPAHVMRTWKFYSVVVADFIKAARAAEDGPGLVYPKKTVILAPTLDEFEDYIIDELFQSDLITPDIETGWGQMTCIGFAASSTSAICVPFVDLSKPNKSYWPTLAEERRAWKLVRDVMESDIPKLGQNFAAYDAFWLLEKYGIRTINLLHDTRLLHNALYPELPKSLSFMAGSYTMQGPWKHWGHKSKGEKRDD